MAVAQGYGKTVTSGLVFAYDTGDTRNSYKGEPTTNSIIGSTWTGDGSNQAFAVKGATVVVDSALKYKGLDTVLWTPGTSLNCYLNGAADLNSADSSTVWTFSCYIKRADGGTLRTSDNLLLVYLYYPNGDGAATGTIQDVGDGWYRVFRTRTGSASYISLAGFTGFAAGYKYYLSGWQLEKVNHPTPAIPINSTRSVTQGLLPLVGNSILDLSTVSFDSNAQIVFDGTDDYFTAAPTPASIQGNSPFTVEGVFKRSGNILQQGLWGIGGGATPQGISSWNMSTNEIGIDLWGTSTYGTGQYYSSTEWKHITWVYKGPSFTTSNIVIYINGVEYTGGNLIVRRGGSGTPNINNTGITLGRISATTTSYHASGQVPIFKVYDRALTFEEVQQNYLHYRTRFNLS